jgi:DNA-binding beta-propeller fold protein YncE
MLKKVVLKIAMSIFAAALLASTSVAREIEQPIALDALPSTGLVVLGAKGTIYELRGRMGRYSVANSFHIPVNQYAVDLTLAQISQEFFIFVASNITSGLGDAGRVTQYAFDGHVVQYWTVRGVCAGIDFDGKTHTVYLATSNRNEILAIKLSPGGKAEVSSLGEISQVTQIGPLAYDAVGSKIYVADVASGGIYAFDLVTRKSSAFAPRFSDVTALRIGPVGRQLIAADSRHKQVVVFDISGKPQSKVMPTGGRLQHPSGLAFVDSGLVAVSDFELGVVFFVSNDGRVVGQF